MVYQGAGKHQEERKELKRDRKGRTVGRKNKLKTISSSTCIKYKLCHMKKKLKSQFYVTICLLVYLTILSCVCSVTKVLY
jgi:hypothetical protein